MVVIVPEDDGPKLDPTRKVVVFGGVEGQGTGSYTLRWDQVRYRARTTPVPAFSCVPNETSLPPGT